MKRIPLRKTAGIILLVSLLAIFFSHPLQQYFAIPTNVTLFEGQEKALTKSDLLKAEVVSASNSVSIAKESDALSIHAAKSGYDQVVLNIAGIPVKKMNIEVLKDFKVIPGGQSIGVKLNTLGVLVVGHHQITTEKGALSPGEIAGIKVGDIIMAINGQKITKMQDVAPFVNGYRGSAEPLVVDIFRDNEKISRKIEPLKDKNEEVYKLGLYIRDSAAGIGTMTFYHPETRKYGALGHVISDMDTKKPIVVKDGQIVKSTVTSIEKGSNGNPGEKLARFAADREVIGNITRNSPFGIFGRLTKQMENGIKNTPLPIALSNEVEEGPAEIYTVVEGNKVEKFGIEIISTIPQKFPATKGMVLKVTDKRLLSKTGGIVQGMSGSPIIQKGKVVGAVTHVFVNDPTSGYGVHIEWMLNEAGIDIYQKDSKAG